MIPKGPNIQATTEAEYKNWVDEAIDEVADLRSFMDFGEEATGENFIDVLEKGLAELKNTLSSGSYQHNDEDLPFMTAVHETESSLLPFRLLLLRINETHRRGIHDNGKLLN